MQDKTFSDELFLDGDDKTSSLLHSLHERSSGLKPSLISNVNEIPVVKPTLAEFLDLPKFMASIASLGSFYGAVKILPPEGWKSRRSYEHVDFLIRCTGSQYSRDVGLNGLYDLHAEESGSMHLSDVKHLLMESQSVDAEHWKNNARRAELDFWRDLGVETNIIYAASCSQSTLFEPIAGAWNLAQMQHKRASSNSWQLSCQGITGLSMNMASTFKASGEPGKLTEQGNAVGIARKPKDVFEQLYADSDDYEDSSQVSDSAADDASVGGSSHTMSSNGRMVQLGIRRRRKRKLEFDESGMVCGRSEVREMKNKNCHFCEHAPKRCSIFTCSNASCDQVRQANAYVVPHTLAEILR
eukprot:768221-Hanusia_phi.AAC.6